MGKDPAFLFYSNDFLTGVADLTFEERGQYITLMALQHQKGHLTKKAIDINVPNVSSDVLAKFIIDEDGLYYNERLEIESEKRKAHSKKQKERAISGWEKRKADQSHGTTTANATALPLEDANEDELTNRINSIKKGVKPKDRIPSLESFIDYGLEKAKANGLTVSKTSLTMKYEAWKEADWINGNGQEIRNWKSSLLNTLQHLNESDKAKQQASNSVYLIDKDGSKRLRSAL
jgi:hypothetical protein